MPFGRKDDDVVDEGRWIITHTDDGFNVKWFKKLQDMKPKLNAKGLPTFVLISSIGRSEIATMNMPYLENQAKKFTQPKGKGKLSTDVCRIYIKQEDGEEVLMGSVTHDVVRHYRKTYGGGGLGNPGRKTPTGSSGTGKGTGGWVKV